MSVKADETFVSTDLPRFTPGEGGLIPLSPLTLWHVWQLQVLANPYAVGGPLTDFARVQAAFITLYTREEWLELFRDEEGEQAMTEFCNAFFALPEAEKAAYRAYIDAHISASLKWPEYWQDGQQGKSLKCPFVWHAVRNLLSMRVAHTESAAWDYNAARAMCWTAVENESQGGKNYISQEERDIAAKLNGGLANG
jgi:hypothetical protein